MTKDELIEFIQRLPENAFLEVESAKFHVQDQVQPRGLRQDLVAIGPSTIEHHLTFSMTFHSNDKYFPDKYMEEGGWFNRYLNQKR